MQVKVTLSSEVLELLTARALRERRSLSAMGGFLIEAGLGEGALVGPGARSESAGLSSSRAAGEAGVLEGDLLASPGPASVPEPPLRNAKLYARAGCIHKIPMGERCSSCGAVHQP